MTVQAFPPLLSPQVTSCVSPDVENETVTLRTIGPPPPDEEGGAATAMLIDSPAEPVTVNAKPDEVGVTFENLDVLTRTNFPISPIKLKPDAKTGEMLHSS